MEKVETYTPLVPLSKECNPNLLHWDHSAVGNCGYTGQLPEESVWNGINVKQSIDE